jgi:uncharacterized protein YqjF (DUF2071 family)
MPVTRPFLTAQWRHLLMVNYAIDPAILFPLVPRGTELDTWNGTTYVSLVGFRFLYTRVKGWRIPFHTHFEEINLRFYVLRKESGEWRRGVVFVKEIVPRTAITLVARWAYNENYVTLPTRHRLVESPELSVRYEWRLRGRWNSVGARAPGEARPLREGEEAQFISEHYWGYTRQRDRGTKEYRVEHPAWNVWDAKDSVVDVDIEALYGRPFVDALNQPPTSAFIADGSEVAVRGGRRIVG